MGEEEERRELSPAVDLAGALGCLQKSHGVLLSRAGVRKTCQFAPGKIGNKKITCTTRSNTWQQCIWTQPNFLRKVNLFLFPFIIKLLRPFPVIFAMPAPGEQVAPLGGCFPWVSLTASPDGDFVIRIFQVFVGDKFCGWCTVVKLNHCELSTHHPATGVCGKCMKASKGRTLLRFQ